MTIFYLVLNFEKNRSKIAAVRVPESKVQNGNHDVIDFKYFRIRGKRHWQISARSFVESFIKIGLSIWAVEITQIDRQTDRHTHTETGRQTDRNTHTDTQTPLFNCNIFSQKNRVGWINKCSDLDLTGVELKFFDNAHPSFSVGLLLVTVIFCSSPSLDHYFSSAKYI